MSPPTLTLGIETSCDETSVAVVGEGRRVLANLISSQVALHSDFGGVVPELAARSHLEVLPSLITGALSEAGCAPSDLGLIAVTRGPGLIGCLLVGTHMASGLADGWGVPLVGVNHLWGHVHAAFLQNPDLQLPLLALVVSGAHSDLVLMESPTRFTVLGRTRDDAAGEAFDKAARMLGLGYPGGPLVDRLARSVGERRQRLPQPSLKGLEYSFSGLKTALLYRLRDLGDEVTDEVRSDLAAAFQESVVGSLMEKLLEAHRAHPVRDVVICGGVAANSRLREVANASFDGAATVTIPSILLCTDNAAMIAAAGAALFAAEGTGSVSADPSLAWA